MTSTAPTLVPPTPKQVEYARLIASKLNAAIPVESANDRRALSDWTPQSRWKAPMTGAHFLTGSAVSRRGCGTAPTARDQMQRPNRLPLPNGSRAANGWPCPTNAFAMPG